MPRTDQVGARETRMPDLLQAFRGAYRYETSTCILKILFDALQVEY